ncbi:MAG: WYL domain-containing protein [Chloroherpetonaceae bacterium]|nr:WYL domain-containing protein [Chloroherpetonaceae bacterium]
MDFIERIFALLEIDRMLKKREIVNAVTISRRFDVSRRTAERLIDDLEQLVGKGSLQYNRQRESFEYVNRHNHIRTLVEIVARRKTFSSLVLEMIPLAENESQRWILYQLIDRIEAELPGSQFYLNDDSYGFEPPTARLNLDDAYFLLQAIKASRKVEIEYYSPSSQIAARYVICPYELRYVQSIWRLVALCDRTGEAKAFELHNIFGVAFRDEFFQKRDLYVDGVLRNAGLIEFDRGEHKVKIEFAPPISHVISNRFYHDTQTLTTLANEHVLFSATVKDLDVVKRWVMKYMPYAKVIEPAILRDSIRRDLERWIVG